MIFICAGLPKSASTICFKYTEACLLQNRKLSNMEYIYRWGIFKSLAIFFNNLFNGNVIVKTHSSPTFFIKLFINLNIARAIYTIRDPRDIILSTIDFKTDNPKQKVYNQHTTIENTIDAVKNEIRSFYNWKKFRKVQFVRYNEIVKHPHKTIALICNYFKINIPENEIENIVRSFNNNPVENFNTGKTDRYKTEMSADEIRFCNKVFGKIITDMGYEL